MSYTDFRSYSELYHHGILGMHWGIRRFQNEDGSLTGAGKKRYDVGSKRDSSHDKVLNEQDIINVGNSAIYDYGYSGYVDVVLDTYAKTGDESLSYKKGEASEYYKVLDKYGNNCPNCALAVELKKRGINVKPKATGGMSSSQIHEVYVGEKTTRCRTTQDFYKAKNYGPPGSHGQFFGYYESGGGHTYNYTVLKDGSIQFEDAQNGKVWHSLSEMRLDPEASANYFYAGEILNLTNAEIDVEYMRQMDMVDESNYQNNMQMRINQYKKKVEKYVKGIKTLETIKNVASKGIIKTILKKINDKIKVGNIFKKK